MAATKQQQQQQSKEEKQKALLAEVIALGGSANDLDLISGVDSDQEGDGAGAESRKAATDEKAIAKELADFHKSLKFERIQRQPASDTEEEEEEVEQDGSAESEVASTPDEEIAAVPEVKLPPSQPVSRQLVVPQQIWHDISLPALPSPSTSYAVSADQIEKMHARGKELLTELNTQYTASLSATQHKRFAGKSDTNTFSTLSKSDKAFISTIMQSGTSSDKLSALILLSSSSPLHCTSYLSQLLSLATKKSRDESTRAVRSLVDWLQNQGLPDRKLRWFADNNPDLMKRVGWAQSASQLRQHPKDARRTGDVHLVCWAFEDWLKQWYLDFLRALETLAQDQLPFVRTQMLPHVYTLLSTKPEQEQNLLVLLVHKLGDGEKAVASRTSFHLLQLLQSHPMMKPLVIRELAAVVLKPLSAHAKDTSAKAKHDHARYYGLITLNQIVLARRDTDIAQKMIDVYFEVFNDTLRQASPPEQPTTKLGKRKRETTKTPSANEEESDSKLVAAVLTGVKRAYPYADMSEDVTVQKLDTLYKISHTSTFTVCVQALSLVHLMSSKHTTLSNRFYRVLYESLLDPRLTTTSKHTIYLNLLFKALRADPSPKRVASFARRLIQVALYHQPPFIIGSLHLLAQLTATLPQLQAMLAAQKPIKVTENIDGHSTAYDPKKREPDFANAGAIAFWELGPLTEHYHPSVAEFAKQLLEQQTTSEAPDLTLYTTARLLDRFAYRDNKTVPVTQGVSAMQPAAAGQDRNDRVNAHNAANTSQEVLMNSEAFWRRSADKIAAHQIFFQTYFTHKNKDMNNRSVKAQSRNKRAAGSDGEDIDDLMDDVDAESASDIGEDDIAMAISQSLQREKNGAEGSESDSDVDIDMASDDDLDIDNAGSDLLDQDDDGSSIFDFDEGSDSDAPMDEANTPATSTNKIKRKKPKLPAFASAEEYATLLASDGDDD